MKKKYQNCTISITGYELDETGNLLRAILRAIVQEKMTQRDEYKSLLERAFGTGVYGITSKEERAGDESE